MMKLPFAQYVALQEYKSSENSVESAFKHDFSHAYFDLSLRTERLANWTDGRIQNIKDLLLEYNIKPIFHGNFKAPLASDLGAMREAAVSYVKREIDLASKFSAPLIVHGGTIVEPRKVEDAKNLAIKRFLLSIKELKEYASQKNVELWVENLSNYTKNHPFYYIFTTPGEFRYIFSEIPSLKFFMDIGHFNVGNDDVTSVIHEFGDNIIGFSMNNNDGLRDQHLSVHSGSVDYQKIIQALTVLNWSGYVGIEVRNAQPKECLEHLANIYNSLN